MRLCVLFPGIGYNCDKPLLYYLSRLAGKKGYEVMPLKFSDFPEGAKGNEARMRQAADHALLQAEEQLSGVDFSGYSDVVFIGKSIGTKAALEFREKLGLSAKAVLLTPLEMTFEHNSADTIAFHGTSDQWADSSEVRRLCRECGVPLYEYDKANHSIETDDVFLNIKYLKNVLEKTDMFI